MKRALNTHIKMNVHFKVTYRIKMFSFPTICIIQKEFSDPDLKELGALAICLQAQHQPPFEMLYQHPTASDLELHTGPFT